MSCAVLGKDAAAVNAGGVAARRARYTCRGAHWRAYLSRMNLPPENPGESAHPLFVRLAHWINAFALIAMILSGWRIYNASPLYEFRFPEEVTLGGWLAGALAWHFAAMWLLVFNGLAYVAYGLLSGHFRRRIAPPGPVALWRDARLALASRLAHQPGRYNAVQRALYLAAFVAAALAVASGLAIWKPVQLQELTALMGGFEPARRVHFFAMTALALFTLLHVGLAVSTKGLIWAMITGRAPRSETTS